MRKRDKKSIMYALDQLIPDSFECNHIRITFPDDDTARIELMNDTEQNGGDPGGPDNQHG